MYQLHADPHSSHRKLSALAESYGRGPVLDVGAAEGYLGQMLADSDLVVDAIEPNPAFAEMARPHYRKLYAVPLEEAALEEPYGTILLGDVLEHLVDPLAGLTHLIRHLKPNGILIASLPNVAHLAVRLLLLSGSFPSMDSGPLDRTHLHFFTRSTAERLLRDAGLALLERHATVVPLADITGGRWSAVGRALRPLQLVGLRLLPGLFAYQWIFVASPLEAEGRSGQPT